MKKVLILLLALVLMVSAAACASGNDNSGSSGSGDAAETEAEEKQHTIAVLVYDLTDDEVQSFKGYLENYIAPIFDVKFLYSESLSTEEDTLSFIEDASEYGAEGIMSFLTISLQKQVELAAEKGMYYIVASGTVADEDFSAVADNEYFLGAIGPGDEMEYSAGTNLANAGLNLRDGKGTFFILSGGGAVGNEMHRLRTVGMLEKFENAYGVKLSKTPEEIASSDEVYEEEAGDLKLCVCPGYFTVQENLDRATSKFEAGDYGIVLGVLPVTKLLDTIRGAKLGVIDCYSQTNQTLFADGQINYVTGKYSSIVGPSFAAMYNAITGHADAFRDNGKAFRLKQSFWSSDSRKDYDEKYSLASSIEKCAYNYADLQSVISEYNGSAGFEDLKALAEASRYEDAVARRAQ